MTKEEYRINEEKIINLLNSIRKKISPDVLRGIEHYLKHGELEMAFELLFLDMIDKNIKYQFETKSDWINLAEELGLKEASVFEDTFWKKFSNYLSQT